MTNSIELRLLVLYTGIFPDADTVLQALNEIDGYKVEREELTDPEMTTADWDRVLEKIIDAKKIVTV